MTSPHIDARGWIGIGAFALTVTVLAMVGFIPGLRTDDFFKTIATLIVGAYIKDVVTWAYSATKSGGELAERNAGIVESSATAATATAAALASGPTPVEIVNDAADPVLTKDA